MADLSLESWLDPDVDWLVASGHQQHLEPDGVLQPQGNGTDGLYVVLGGQLRATVADDPGSSLGKAFSAISGEENLERELFPLQQGDVVGEMVLLPELVSPMKVTAVVPSTVLMVPQAALTTKLSHDLGFAARCHRSLAALVLSRYELLLDTFGPRRRLQLPPVEDAPGILGHLYDTDLEWLSRHGAIVTLGAGERLVHPGGSAETIYVIQSGLLSTLITPGKATALTQLFSQIFADDTQGDTLEAEVFRSSTGEIVGETTLLRAAPPRFAVQAMEPSVVLAVPIQELTVKLDQDRAMAARFYRVLMVFLAHRLVGLIRGLGYHRNG